MSRADRCRGSIAAVSRQPGVHPWQADREVAAARQMRAINTVSSLVCGGARLGVDLRGTKGWGPAGFALDSGLCALLIAAIKVLQKE